MSRLTLFDIGARSAKNRVPAVTGYHATQWCYELNSKTTCITTAQPPKVKSIAGFHRTGARYGRKMMAFADLPSRQKAAKAFFVFPSRRSNCTFLSFVQVSHSQRLPGKNADGHLVHRVCESGIWGLGAEAVYVRQPVSAA